MGMVISPSDARRWICRGSSANLSTRSRCCLASSTPNISAIDLRYSCGENVALDLTDVDMCRAFKGAHARAHGGMAAWPMKPVWGKVRRRESALAVPTTHSYQTDKRAVKAMRRRHPELPGWSDFTAGRNH